jgi:hypothetical protein
MATRTTTLEDVQPDQQTFSLIDPSGPSMEVLGPAAAISQSLGNPRQSPMQRTTAAALEDNQADQRAFGLIDPPDPSIEVIGPAAATSQSLGAGRPGNTQRQVATRSYGAAVKPKTAYAQEAPPDAAASSSLKDADYVVEVGDSPDPEREASESPAAIPLTNQAMYEMIRNVAAGHSGDTLYSAISTDREFATPGHEAYQKRHFGLGFGILLFTQESGQLGAVLQLMHDRDSEQFSRIFGADSDALLAVTNAETPEARLQPVAGENLWSPAWVSRFQAAGAYPLFQAAQNEHAIEAIFRPLLHVASGFGLTSDRLLAMAVDVAVGRGLGGAIRWLAHHIGPFETPVQRYHAIEALGVDNLANFQAEVGWTPQDGQFGPETHAALAGAIRRLDIIPLPKASDLACRMVAVAEGALKQRLLRLRDSQAFTDRAYELN